MDLFWRGSDPSWGGTSQEGEFLHAWIGFALEQPALGLQLNTTDEEMEMEEEEVKGRELTKIMVDTAIKLYGIQKLRKEYREALPHIEKNYEVKQNIFLTCILL